MLRMDKSTDEKGLMNNSLEVQIGINMGGCVGTCCIHFVTHSLVETPLLLETLVWHQTVVNPYCCVFHPLKPKVCLKNIC